MLQLPKILAISLAVLPFLQGARTEVEKERMLLEGKWEVVSIVFAGKTDPDAKDGKMTFHFQGDKLTVKLGDKVMNEGTYRLTPNRTPKGIDLVDGKEREAVLGIYEVKDNEAKLCMGLRGKDRPKEFAAAAGKDQSLVTLKRLK